MSVPRTRFFLASSAVLLASVLAFACLGEDVGGSVTADGDASPDASAASPDASTLSEASVVPDAAGGPGDASDADASPGPVDAGPDVGPPATGDVTSVIRLGTTGLDESGPLGAAFDADGNLFVAGSVGGSAMSLGGNCSISNVSKSDAFVARFDASGSCTAAQVWSSIDEDQAVAIAVDPVSKDVVVTGVTLGAELKMVGQASAVAGRGASFIAKLSNDLGTVRWATRFGTGAVGTSGPRALSISSAGKIAVGGDFAGTSGTAVNAFYDSSSATYTTTPVGPYIPYLFQLTSAGQLDTGSRVFQPKVGSNCPAVTLTSVAYDVNRDLYFAMSVFGGSVGSPCEIYESVPVSNGAQPRFVVTAAGVTIGRYQTSANGLWQNVTYALPAANRGYLTVDPAGRVIVAYRYANAQTQKLGDIAPVIPATQKDDVLVVSYEEDKVLGTFGPKAYLLAGSPEGDQPFDVQTDRWGNVVVGGFGYGGFKAGGANGVGYADAGVLPAGVVFKCRPGLASCAWARLTGGNNEVVHRVAVDGAGRTAARGNFNAPSMTLGATKLDNLGQLDGFLGILSP